MGSADYNQLRKCLILDPAIEHAGVGRPRTETPRVIVIVIVIVIAMAKGKKECVTFPGIMICEFVHLNPSLRDAGQTRLDETGVATLVFLLLLLTPGNSSGDERGRHFRR
jgi:hypothetical protein